MSKGKKYADSAKLIEKSKLVRLPLKLWIWSARPPRQSSMRPSKSTSVWALTPVTQTSRFVARSFSRTVPVRLSAPSFSQRATRARLLARAAGADFVGDDRLRGKDPEGKLVRFRRRHRYPGYDGYHRPSRYVCSVLRVSCRTRRQVPLPWTLPRPFTEAKAGKIEYRLDKTNIIHCPIGKASFGSGEARGELQHSPRRYHQG